MVHEEKNSRNIPVFSNNPSGVCWGTNKVSTEVGTLQSSSLCSSDIEGSLELGIENIEETVCET